MGKWVSGVMTPEGLTLSQDDLLGGADVALACDVGPALLYEEKKEHPSIFAAATEIIDLCTILWYTLHRSDKQERLVIFVAATIGRGSRSALAANIAAP